MTALSVNLNKIALVRNSRTIGIPSVVQAGEICIQAGAYGLTVHPRPDERHIRRHDVYDLAEMLTAHPRIEFNIEGNPLEAGFMEIVRDIKPNQVTLVPDDPNQFTSDHGWNVSKDGESLVPIIQEIQGLGARVSLFMDPDPEQIRLIPKLGVMAGTTETRIELYTEPYATAAREGTKDELATLHTSYAVAAKVAKDCGLGVNAGHDLNLENLPQFLRIPNILEVSIGHALTADALIMGLGNAVTAYLDVIAKANQQYS
ncbi:pyridoxine 5 -phosphate synthase [Leptolyngbya sp. Heron Island J]|uniref:pyridoxine 5'-phosphate synthase n=1 Tax=Leptolyngbya sp. Heron Island J TaxID=1385935 RepID=UPI0003B9E1C5|nr:pyridoxine 5'-phosphate synthase [Leptolyngbya sp. Heron Island J]ESA34545.1 pyridoxine 5 -phosphate synthase [Leptolyngbya sp. Heron Island J]